MYNVIKKILCFSVLNLVFIYQFFTLQRAPAVLSFECRLAHSGLASHTIWYTGKDTAEKSTTAIFKVKIPKCWSLSTRMYGVVLQDTVMNTVTLRFSQTAVP